MKILCGTHSGSGRQASIVFFGEAPDLLDDMERYFAIITYNFCDMLSETARKARTNNNAGIIAVLRPCILEPGKH
jgi:hypothetical protein